LINNGKRISLGSEKRKKAIVLGIDAGTYNLINYFISKGKLPIFEKVIREGFSAILKSCHPPITFPAWKCLTTGLGPGRLGVYCFYVWDRKENKMHMASAHNFKAKDVWDYLGNHGYKVAIVNVPGTFPPKRVNGYMISGHFAFDDKSYTYPPELKRFIVKEYNYKVEFLRDFRNADENQIVKEAIEMIKTRFEVTKYFILEKNVDFVFSTIFVTDSFGHCFWNKLHRDGNPIERVYTAIDNGLRSLTKIANDENFNLLIVSDHGMCQKRMEMEINTWLYNNHYLHLRKNVFKTNVNDTIAKCLFDLFDKLSFQLVKDKVLTKMIGLFSPEKIYKIADGIQKKDRFSDISIFDSVDWKRTTAFAWGLNCLSVLEEKEKDRKLKEITEKLSSVVDPRTQTKIFREIKLGREVYGKTALGNPPDIVLIPNYGYVANSKLSSMLDPYDYSANGWKAVHDYDGIFIAYGPDVRKNIPINPSPTFEIYDVAPTVLSLYGVPIPSVDGKVREEILVHTRKS